MSRRWRLAILGAVLGLFAAGAIAQSTVFDRGARMSLLGSKPPPGVVAADFHLRDAVSGEPVSMRSLRGKAVVITFLESRCDEQCPVIASTIAGALRRLPADERRDVAALAISVNPADDTRASVRRFLARRRALGSLRYLVGSGAALRRVWRAYGVYSAAESGDADVHSADVRIYDRDGVWRSTLRPGRDLGAGSLLNDVRFALAAG